MLGSCASVLPTVNIPALRSGPRLSKEAGEYLSQEVTGKEIDLAMWSIADDKAPGLDGLNAVFFKQSWNIIKGDIYSAIQEFFRTGIMSKLFNVTSVTLVPKVPNPTRVQEYRPIACCNILRLFLRFSLEECKALLIVQDCQAGFIPGRPISENILLATEFFKGYGRANVSPRCMLKIDLKKAYDSLEWSFLHDVMKELGFPETFVQWIFACITTVSYSILINGRPCAPFEAKKGLRQAAPFLFAIGMEYLTRLMQQLYKNPNFHPKCEKF